MSSVSNNSAFWKRFYVYQKERFPFLGHGLMIAVFTFSAIAYARMGRGMEGFISWKDYGVGVFTTFTLFFLVRILDEFKDKEDDAKYRTYLAVPRGLVSLKELRIVGWIIFILQASVIYVFQREMLGLYAVVMIYLALMSLEFFVPKFLKSRQLLYITSHMFIIPLIDIYASGLDWFKEGVSAPLAMYVFFALSYMNGLVLEFGRKLRSPEKEEEGVVSYTKLYGVKGGVYVWFGTLITTLILSFLASYILNYAWYAYLVFGLLFILNILPAIQFLKNTNAKAAKQIEYASIIWTIMMYLSLGAIPMIEKML